MSYTDYCTCKDCKNADPTERNGYKWFCKEYGSYEDPDETVKDKKCTRFRERN